MINVRKNRIMLFLGFLFLFLLAAGSRISRRNQLCMGIPMVSEEYLAEFTETSSLDIRQILLNGERAPVDTESNTLYISQSPDKLYHYSAFQGILGTSDADFSLLFLETDAFADIASSVSQNQPFSLILLCGRAYQRVNVVVTTFPVICLDGEGENEKYGTFSLFGASGPGQNHYEVDTSDATWHVRGWSSRRDPKKSYKLTLLKDSGENNQVSLLDLGSDDDWILNPMCRDDTFVKEMLAQEIWNGLAAKTAYNYKMTTGRYAELIINDSYYGLIVLQRRVDTKYLELDETADIMLKGNNAWENEKIDEKYEVISTPWHYHETCMEMIRAMETHTHEYANLDNLTDVSLFLQLLSARDNANVKNMFYVIKQAGEGAQLYWVPWDTDLSLGVAWGYDYETCMNNNIERQELEIIRQHYPDFDEQLAQRWQELRKDDFSEETILSRLDSLEKLLSESGAVARDYAHWGWMHSGEDNLANLRRFIQERLLLLDNYYLGTNS